MEPKGGRGGADGRSRRSTANTLSVVSSASSAAAGTEVESGALTAIISGAGRDGFGRGEGSARGSATSKLTGRMPPDSAAGDIEGYRDWLFTGTGRSSVAPGVSSLGGMATARQRTS